MTTTAPYSLPPSPQTNGLPVTVEANIAKALVQTAGMTLAQKFEWFFFQVMPHGPMDYKYAINYPTYNSSQASQDFGNFNYGVVGTALGIPIEILDRFAGYAQVGADVFLNLKLPNAPWGSDFGDNPGDQAKINEGIVWAESNGYINITNLTENAQGTEGNDVLWIGDDFLGLLNLLNGVTLNGGGGNDFIVGSKGSDELQGGTGNDILYGQGNDDFMYGDQGDDVLHGGKGTDWLEGGEGNDTLEGGEIVGVNADNSVDTLKGGKGNDFLAGGNGFDTYIYNSGDGFDAIVDSDGSGQIKEDGIVLGEGKLNGDNRVYQFTDGNNKKHTYVFVTGNKDTGGDIVVDGNMLIKNFQAGNLGLNLTGPEADPQLNLNPETDNDITGDFDPLDTDPTQDGVQSQPDQWGNPLPGNPNPTHADYLNDSPGNDKITSGGGNDVVNAFRGGHDLIELGTGNDFAMAGDGNDVVKGGAGDDIVDGGLGDDILLGEADKDILKGGAGKDTLLGGTEQDILSGGIEDDKLYADTQVTVAAAIANGNGQTGSGLKGDWLSGEQGDDTLIGGIGNDVLAGGSGNDLLIGGAGDDHIIGDANWVVQDFNWNVTKTNGEFIYNGAVGEMTPADFGNDVVYAGKGDDYVWTGSGNDVIFGEDGIDSLNGQEGNDILFGGEGNDTLSGQVGDDVLVGGNGNDFLAGDSGYDTYIINANEGKDTIFEPDRDSNLIFGAGIDETTIKLSLDHISPFANDPTVYTTLKLDLGDGNTVDIAGIDQNDIFKTSSVNSFSFADGTTLNIGQLLARGIDLAGSAADDTIYGTNTTDRISGMGGVNRLIGGAGDDFYINVTGGDTINDTEGHSTIQLAQANGIGIGGLVVTNFGDQGQYRRLDIALDSGETLKLEDAFYGTDATLQFANGSQLDLETLVGTTLTTALNLSLGDDGGKLYGGAGADTLYGGAGNDTLSGHKGNDTLTGGAGDDTYVYNLGDGMDTIYETSGNNDVLRFGAGILPSQVTLSRNIFSNNSEENITFSVPNPNQSQTENQYNLLHLKNFFNANNSANSIDRVEFADGTVWTYADIKAKVFVNPTESGEFIRGFFENDAIDGLGGNDNIRGLSGDDTLKGGAGNDTIEGGKGNDILEGGDGNDSLTGYGISGGDDSGADNEPGNDTLYGGAGDDVMQGGYGADMYLFGRGDGYDKALDNGQDGLIDTLRLGAGVLPGHVKLYGSTLVIDGSRTQIEFTGIERIEFDNGAGPVWLAADIEAHKEPFTTVTMTGTAGNDTFNIGFGDGTIIEAVNGGIDTVLASTTYRLPANVENLTLTGSLYSGAYGNNLDNVLIGNIGDNILQGEAGNDTMQGGMGDDTYYVDSVNDIVIENANEGIDTIYVDLLYSKYSYTLEANQENLYFKYLGSGVSWPTRISGTGNDLDNVLKSPGGGFLVTLDGKAGADTMVINGSDTAIVYVDNPGDKIFTGYEPGIFSPYHNGAYIITSSIDYSLDQQLYNTNNDRFQSNVSDRLVLNGTNATTGTGNASNNYFNSYENTAANILKGGMGDDKYFIGLNDTVIEAAGEGHDVVYLSTLNSIDDNKDFRISDLGFANIEGLVLTGGAWNTRLFGDAQDNTLGVDFSYNQNQSAKLYGDAGNDTLSGNAGDDLLDGGTGADIMYGGAGNDTYVVDNVGDLVSDVNSEKFYSISAWDKATLMSAYPYSYINATGGSSDTVLASVSYTLSYYVENLTLTGTANIDGIGNSQNNILIGNDSANSLLGDAGLDQLNGNGGDDYLDGGAGIDQLFGGGGNDTLSGGAGNDELYGNEGADTYLFDRGWGQDYVSEFLVSATAGEIDTIQFGAGIAASDIEVIRTSNDLILTLRGTTDTITVGGYFIYESPDYNNQIEKIRFADNTVWDVATVAAGIISVPTNLDDILYGSALNDAIDGLGGGDEIYGLGGDDTLYGGDGDDYLDGDYDPINSENYVVGNDTLYGGNGNDIIYGDGGDDILNGDAGNDELYGELGNDILNGGDGIDYLEGNDGYDRLNGGIGADELLGGLGNDTYVVDTLLDVVTEDLGEGIDTVEANITYSLANIANIENLALTGTGLINGTGNALDNVLIGNGVANTLTGGGGNDRLIGGAGNDTLKGGLGNDTYVLDVATDIVTENLNEGIDTVETNITFDLTNRVNVENLTLTGTAAINGTGNTLSNVLVGNGASNTLNGGTGIDTLVGGAGNDTYVVDNTSDVVTEQTGEGTDLVQSSATYTLSANVENLTLTSTGVINGTGNDLDNVLTGNGAANILTGGAGNDRLIGGLGNDTMKGGLGNDTYVVDVATDVITELSSEGIDTVESNITFDLTNRANVENLTLMGSIVINGTGNALDNVLTGNGAANTLTGGAGNDRLIGGLGNDTMKGGTGNDTYMVDVATDIITELASEGTDTVESAITFDLTNRANVENLTLTGTGAANGTGNTSANVLIGNSGINSLSGGAGNDTLDGGAGADTLTGAAGNDTYKLGRGYGVDTVVDTDATVGNTDVAQFLAGVANDQLWFRHVGTNLEVSIIGTSDKMTISNWYGGAANHVEQFKTTDGAKTLLDTKVENLVSAMAAFAPPAAGQTTLPTNYQTALAPVIAANWQ